MIRTPWQPAVTVGARRWSGGLIRPSGDQDRTGNTRARTVQRIGMSVASLAPRASGRKPVIWSARGRRERGNGEYRAGPPQESSGPLASVVLSPPEKSARSSARHDRRGVAARVHRHPHHLPVGLEEGLLRHVRGGLPVVGEPVRPSRDALGASVSAQRVDHPHRSVLLPM